MNKHTQAVRPGFVLAVALLFLAPMVASAQGAKDSAEFSGFLAQAKSEAVQVQQIAEEMNSFNSNVGWRTQAGALEELKRHVNKLGEFVISMNNVEAPSRWQQNAIGELTPMVEQLAAQVTMAFYHLDATHDAYVFGSFPEYVAANAELAPEITQMISDYVAYDETKQKAKEAADELQRARWSREHFED